MKKTHSLMFVAIALAACGGAPVATQMPSGASGGDGTGNLGTMTLHNTSRYDIHSIQLSPFDNAQWGANLIDGDVLMHGEDATLAVFDCKKYDLRMLDDEGVECVVQDIDLCFEDRHWTLDDTMLGACATGWAD